MEPNGNPSNNLHTVTFSDPERRPPELRDSSLKDRSTSVLGIVTTVVWERLRGLLVHCVGMGRAKVDSGEAVGTSRSLGWQAEKVPRETTTLLTSNLTSTTP